MSIEEVILKRYRVWRIFNAILLLLVFVLPIVDEYAGWVIVYWGLSFSGGILSTEFLRLSLPLFLILFSLLALAIYAFLNIRVSLFGLLGFSRIWLIISLIITIIGYIFLGVWFSVDTSVLNRFVTLAWGYWIVLVGLLSSVFLEMITFQKKS